MKWLVIGFFFTPFAYLAGVVQGTHIDNPCTDNTIKRKIMFGGMEHVINNLRGQANSLRDQGKVKEAAILDAALFKEMKLMRENTLPQRNRDGIVYLLY